MNADYLNLTLYNFLDVITDTKIKYQMTINGEHSIFGYLSELTDFVESVDEEAKKIIKPLLQDKKEYAFDFELTDIEIFNYLEKITGNFNSEKVKIVLREIDCYYHMEYLERINEESTNIYLEKGWEIPLIDICDGVLIKEKISIPNYEEMRKKTHSLSSWNIDRTIQLLKSKLKDKVETKENLSDDILRVFGNENNFKLFEKIKESVNEKHKIADYSFYYWKMYTDKKIFVKPTEFKNWLFEKYDIDLGDKVKTLDNCKTLEKETIYSNAKRFNNNQFNK